VRPIGAIVGNWERMDKTGGPFKFVYRELEDQWVEMDQQIELYTWLTATLAEALYPETRK
jgi:hypothetical protein